MSDAATTASTPESLKLCDIVMKGGITSGLVYPPAILELARKYRFVSIGGTSAGGIVAALTAAAEYARQRGDADAFTRMQTYAGELQAKGRLKDLFQPAASLRAPLGLFLYALRGGTALSRTGWGFLGILVHTPLAFIAGLLGGFLLALGLCDAIAALLRLTGAAPPTVLALIGKILAFGLLGVVSGVLAGALSVTAMLFTRLPRLDYGICPGHREEAVRTDDKPLTGWLHEKINGLAGRGPEDPPLTVGDLDTVGITVRMMTSNISQGQPFVLPFRDRVWIFREDEIRALFPASVVKHLMERSYKSTRVTLPAGYYFMPLPADFPLIVAARFSLSFPVLISAVPLYTVKHSSYMKTRTAPGQPLAPEDLQRNLFSDGGISSNFPIHFFDAWYPDRPTFGINLTNWSPDAFADAQCDRMKSDTLGTTSTEMESDPVSNDDEATRAVFLPAANSSTPPEIQPINSLGGFIMAIFSTAQNFRDNAQAHLPSYRERIVQIRLSDDEGGLNLDMGADMIQEMLRKGTRAGQLLRDDFQMDPHKWVRLMVLMQQLENQLQDLHTTLTPEEYRRLITEMQSAVASGAPFPYSRDTTWVRKADAAMPGLFELLEKWKDITCFSYKHPHPASVLRVSPDFDVHLESTSGLIND